MDVNSTFNQQKMEQIDIIIPCYNEELNISVVYKKLKDTLTDVNWKVIFINDGSKDNTLAVLRDLGTKFPNNVKYISFSKNFGHQNALKAGIDHSTGDCAIMMDADLQHPPELVKQLIDKWREGFEVVATKRMETRGISFFKKLTAKLYYKIVSLLSEVNIMEGEADFRLVDKKIIRVLKESFNEYYLFYRGIIPSIGFSKYTIEFIAPERLHGKTSYTLGRMIRFAIVGVTSFSTKPLRIATFLGFLGIFFSIMYGLYILVMKTFYNATIVGWSSIALLILFWSSMQCFFLGIIGEYIGKMYFEIKKRPHYIIQENKI